MISVTCLLISRNKNNRKRKKRKKVKRKEKKQRTRRKRKTKRKRNQRMKKEIMKINMKKMMSEKGIDNCVYEENVERKLCNLELKIK